MACVRKCRTSSTATEHGSYEDSSRGRVVKWELAMEGRCLKMRDNKRDNGR